MIKYSLINEMNKDMEETLFKDGRAETAFKLGWLCGFERGIKLKKQGGKL